MRTRLLVCCLVLILTAVATRAETPLGTAFTYQGQLKNSGSPASGNFIMVFQLFDALTLGNQIGPTLTFNGAGGNPPPIIVTEGLFTVPIDFGAAAFGGNKRWLSITVGGTTLTPRQELTAAPNALNADKLDGLNSTAFLQSIPVPLALTGTINTHIIRAENASTGFLPMAIYGYCTGASGGTTGVRGESASTSGRGVIGFATAATGTTYGGQFESTSPTGTGVWGKASATSGSAYGVEGESASVSGRGVYGLATAATGSNSGVYGDSVSTTGIGVRGRAQATTGANYGGFFATNSTSGIGVFGDVNATTGTNYGVYGESASTSGTGVKGVSTAGAVGVKGEGGYGVYGSSTSTTGQGVVGLASAATGATKGVYGQSASINGTGVYGTSEGALGLGVVGLATDPTGLTYGGYFDVESPNGIGVWGHGGIGVWGRSNEDNQPGVYGQAHGDGAAYGVHGRSTSHAGRGVFGEASANSGTTYGVYGAADSPDGYALYANGDTGASGSKSFRIDHPDDPANKYLLHYSAESPEVINFYSETVTLDERGEAVVELPHYFAKINTRPRYQLTAVGAPMPMLHVAAEIDAAALIAGAKAEPGDTAPNCSFRIAGGAPGARVSWEVKAMRNDRWVQQRGAAVEVEKSAWEKGKYQHPALYGQPPEKGMDFNAERERSSPESVPGSSPE